MIFPRQSGVLLHPTSLPGRFGIGDLGTEAFKFVDILAAAGQHLWQILPVGLTGIGNSPYASASIFAGNPLLINPDMLILEGLLKNNDLDEVPAFSEKKVDYNTVRQFKSRILKTAFDNFKKIMNAEMKGKFESFCSEQSGWLDTYSLYMAVKEYHHFERWQEWQDDIKYRKPESIDKWTAQLKDSIEYYKFEQFIFTRQWDALKQHCHNNNISIIGDMPIFVDADSDSVWINPQLFNLKQNGDPSAIAGVPPDYFSKTGQLWGNPTYNWKEMEDENYKWWKERFLGMLSRVDIIRLDHFLGFESYWEIPAGSKTAVNGKWIPGPGEKFFRMVEQSIGPLPIIAEDLGMITDGVRKLRDRLGFPGMRVLQFAFGDESYLNEHKPFNYIPHCVAYTATHDNDTTVGWFNNSSNKTTLNNKQIMRERKNVLQYTGSDGLEINWDFIRLALSSVANTAITPLQDIMGLDTNARMNIPSTIHGNWEWRFNFNMLTDNILSRFKDMTLTYGRNDRHLDTAENNS